MIVTLTPEQAAGEIGQLADLLIDAVDSGASIGFLPPLGKEEALAYWREVIAEMAKGGALLAVVEGNWCKERRNWARNAREREPSRRGDEAVRAPARGCGLAKQPWREESAARRLGRTPLVMDTRKGGEAGSSANRWVMRIGRSAGPCAQRGRAASHDGLFLSPAGVSRTDSAWER
jgi:hypothetical protein